MSKRQDIENEARSWIGTPFHHQARVKGAGVDCAGVVIETAKALELAGSFVDSANYAANPDGSMTTLLREHMTTVAWEDRRQGDVVHIAWSRIPQHIGILTDKDTLIHAWGQRGCIETRIGGPMRVRGVYRFRGIE